MVPHVRILQKNTAAIRSDGEYVLYWMIATRRTRWNFAMDRAAEWAEELGKPLLVFEALRTDYRWASDRIHRFIIDGMRDNAAALRGSGIGYFPYVEPKKGAGKGLLRALAGRAAVVVTDEFPCFFLPEMVKAAARTLDVKLEAVDSNGLLPLAAADRAFNRAFDFRRFLQRELPDHLTEFPRQSIRRGAALPECSGVPDEVSRRWPAASTATLAAGSGLEQLPIDHRVPPVVESGGYMAAQLALRRFLDRRLDRYGAERNDPDA
ncbi:MAG: deoxyribodipyrimidine photolyase, partial [Acidobacteriota bacterium]|nr:deoxyribodipyrimidine photolyase [Acidobacteriota bacterium]